MNTGNYDAAKAPALSKKQMWTKIAGAAAMLVVGFILYRKRKPGLGAALMSSSINVLGSAATEG